MKLTNLEKYAIRGMNSEGKSAAEISEAVNRPVKTIEKFLEKEPKQETVEAPVAVSTPLVATPDISTRSLIKGLTKGGRQGVTTMTEAASERADETRKNASAVRSRGSKGAVYNIDENRVE